MSNLKRWMLLAGGAALLLVCGCATKSGDGDQINSKLQEAPVMKPGENPYKRPK